MFEFNHDNELYHHGIKGQQWGVRNGPPYPLGGGDYSEDEKEAIGRERRRGNSIYNKRHFDKTIRTDETLSTLSYDRNRTQNTDMFYATYKTLDKHQYNALFNRQITKPIFDENGNEIGTGHFLKVRIDNIPSKEIKVASEDSGADAFKKLYKQDRDFFNFVTDPNRMQSYFISEKYKFKGYREAADALDKIRSDPSNVKASDLWRAYRMFNYVLPYDGAGNAAKGKDVLQNRTKFFKALKEAGYGACLDTNDAIYGGFKATAPVIVFDMDSIMPKSVYQTTLKDKEFSKAVLAGRKLLGI